MTDEQREHLKKRFLEAFAVRGVVSHAVQEIGCGRTTVYNWIDDDPEFAAAFREAEIASTERLEAEVYRRAHDGVVKETGVYYEGQLVGKNVMTEYADTLAMFLLKARKPAMYRDRLDVTSNGETIKSYGGLDVDRV